MKIKVSLDSGANIHSRHINEIELNDLGMTEQEWEEADEQKKYEAVAEFWNGMGFPEISWEELG